jgi:hypothetical protein
MATTKGSLTYVGKKLSTNPNVESGVLWTNGESCNSSEFCSNDGRDSFRRRIRALKIKITEKVMKK